MSALNKLSATLVKSVPGGKYGDGGNLWLHKADETRGKWLFYFTIGGKRREMGLGAYPGITLKEARGAADKWRKVVQSGLDPIKVREKERREALRNLHLLKDIAHDAFEARKAELKEDGKAGRWFSPLELHILPRLGTMPVADIDQIDIRDTLTPIWHRKASTAKKAMERLGICLKHAAALGLDVDLQAVEKARALLGKQRHTVKHIPSLAWQETPAFYDSLNEGTTTHLALRLLILTAVRSSPLRFLQVDHLDGDIWTIPAVLMKGRKGATTDFRVPLSEQAQEIIAQARPMAREGYLFPSERKGVISDATMSRMMKRRGMDACPHGFRSTFRVWARECQNIEDAVPEIALAHAVGNKTTRAYDRSDALEKRRVLMQRWANFVTATAGEIVRFG